MTDHRPHILFAWELGAHFGHASKILEVAGALGDAARLSVAARNPAGFRQLAPDLAVDLLAAPVAAPRRALAAPDHGQSYPDDLRHCGWRDPAELAALVEAWTTLYRLAKPDLIVAQAAPTALLAARGLDLPTAMVGSGYDAPPRCTPMPPFLFWQPERRAEVARREARILDTANAALARWRRPALDCFADVLRTDTYGVATFAEVDHYAPRSQFEPGHPPYLGQLVTLDKGAEIDWLPGARRRILVYLRPGLRGFDACMGALAGLGPDHDVVLAAPGASLGLRDQLAGAPVRLIDGPVRLDRLLGACDLGICHASNGIAAAFILHGVPQIGLPGHAEQVMVARSVMRHRLGLGLIGDYGTPEVARAISRVLADADIAPRVRAVAARVARDPGTAPGPAMARALLALV